MTISHQELGNEATASPIVMSLLMLGRRISAVDYELGVSVVVAKETDEGPGRSAHVMFIGVKSQSTKPQTLTDVYPPYNSCIVKPLKANTAMNTIHMTICYWLKCTSIPYSHADKCIIYSNSHTRYLTW